MLLNAMVDLVVHSNPRHPAELLREYDLLGQALLSGDRDATVRAFESACSAVKRCLAEARKERGQDGEKRTRIEAGVILLMGSLQFRATASQFPDDKPLIAAADRCEDIVQRTFATWRFFGR